MTRPEASNPLKTGGFSLANAGLADPATKRLTPPVPFPSGGQMAGKAFAYGMGFRDRPMVPVDILLVVPDNPVERQRPISTTPFAS